MRGCIPFERVEPVLDPFRERKKFAPSLFKVSEEGKLNTSVVRTRHFEEKC